MENQRGCPFRQIVGKLARPKKPSGCFCGNWNALSLFYLDNSLHQSFEWIGKESNQELDSLEHFHRSNDLFLRNTCWQMMRYWNSPSFAMWLFLRSTHNSRYIFMMGSCTCQKQSFLLWETVSHGADACDSFIDLPPYLIFCQSCWLKHPPITCARLQISTLLIITECL